MECIAKRFATRGRRWVFGFCKFNLRCAPNMFVNDGRVVIIWLEEKL